MNLIQIHLYSTTLRCTIVMLVQQRYGSVQDMEINPKSRLYNYVGCYGKSVFPQWPFMKHT